jgi:hypothetical protein
MEQELNLNKKDNKCFFDLTTHTVYTIQSTEIVFCYNLKNIVKVKSSTVNAFSGKLSLYHKNFAK